MLERQQGIKGKLIRALDASSSAHLTTGKDIKELTRSIIGSGELKQDRLIAIINLAGNYIPGLEERLRKDLFPLDKFPIQSSSTEYKFRSGDSTGFFVKVDEEGKETELKVVKVFGRSIGLDSPRLFAFAKSVDSDFKQIKHWYSNLPSFLPDQDTLIIHSHVFSLPAVATIQPYIVDKKSGVFEDFTDEQLVYRLMNDKPLTEQFMYFGERLLRMYEEESKCIDIAGENNLLLVENGNEDNIVLVDPCICTLEGLEEYAPDVKEKLESRVKLVSSVMERIRTS